MVKRSRSSPSPPFEVEAEEHVPKQEEDEESGLGHDDEMSVPTKKRVKSRPVKQNRSTTKTAWSRDEDAILREIVSDLINKHLWQVVKADGRLVHRTSYGVQYHAKMLLNRGIAMTKSE